MALTWIEDGESRQATIVRKGRKAASNYQKSYKVFGTTDDVELHTAINAKVTLELAYWQYPGLVGMQLRAEQYSVSYLGDDAWQVTISYSKDGAEDGTDPLKRTRSFDTTGGTQHITQALNNVTVLTSKTGSTTVTSAGETIYPSTQPSMNGAIGVDDNGVNGVDITIPALTWSESYDVPAAYVTSAYIKAVAGLTGSVNNASFRTFAAGEVLFTGCTGAQEWDDQKGHGPWSLVFRFIASPNVTGQKIGDITGIAKKGHEYLWVSYANEVSTSTLVKKPRAVYVNKVYRDGDFSGLGIGTT
jgi:hypothetical protein